MELEIKDNLDMFPNVTFCKWDSQDCMNDCREDWTGAGVCCPKSVEWHQTMARFLKEAGGGNICVSLPSRVAHLPVKIYSKQPAFPCKTPGLVQAGVRPSVKQSAPIPIEIRILRPHLASAMSEDQMQSCAMIFHNTKIQIKSDPPTQVLNSQSKAHGYLLLFLSNLRYKHYTGEGYFAV